MVRGGEGVLGEGAVAPAEHRVPGLEPGHLAPDRLHGPGEVHAPDRDLGLANPKPDDQTDQIRQAGHDMPVAPVQAGRMHLHQDLVACGHRLVDGPELEHVGVRRTGPARSPAWWPSMVLVYVRLTV